MIFEKKKRPPPKIEELLKNKDKYFPESSESKKDPLKSQ